PLVPEGLRALKTLRKEDIRVNVTLCFSAVQALLAAKAGATYISPFLGRVDDVAEHGAELLAQIARIYDNYGFDTQILAASIRGPLHVLEAAEIGAHCATMPIGVLRQLPRHPLT